MSTFSDQDDLDVVWGEVARKCTAIAGWDLEQEGGLTIAQVVGKINPGKEVKPSRKEVARMVFLNVLKCINQLASIMAQGANMGNTFGPGQQCSNAVSLVIGAVHSYHGVFENVVTLMERVSVFLERLQLHLSKKVEAATKLDPRLRTPVYRVFALFLDILARSYRLANDWKRRTKLAIKIGAFGDDEGIKDSLIQLETLVSDVTHTAITVIVEDLSDAAKDIRKIDAKIDTIVDKLHRISTQEAERLTMEYDEKDRQRIRSLDFVPDAAFDSARNARHEQCVPHTRTDILRQIELWAEDSAAQRLFWLGGIAGTGKSTIAKTVAFSLAQRHHLLSFFFERGSGDASSSSKVLRTIAYQLSFISPLLRHYISEAIAQDESLCRSSAATEQFRKLIIQPFRKWQDACGDDKHIVVVLDALDECEDGENIRGLLQQLIAGAAKNPHGIVLRVFVTSRPEVASEHLRELQTTRYAELTLDGSSRAILDADIRAFVSHELQIIKRERKVMGHWPEDQHVETLVEKADGLFIYAATACRFIKGSKWVSPKRRLEEICKSTNKANQQVDDMYTKILRHVIASVDEEELDEVCASIRRVTGALVILLDNVSVSDLNVLLDDEKGDGPSADDVLQNLQAVISVNGVDGMVRLIHSSFRDFLLDRTRCVDQRFAIDAEQAHRNMAWRCLDIMKEQLRENMCDVESAGTFVTEVGESQIEAGISPSLDYACRFWLEHVVESGMDLEDGADVHDFLRDFALHYFETMGWIGRIADCVLIFTKLENLTTSESTPKLHDVAYDLLRFVSTFRRIASLAPLQLYYAAAHFTPSSSMVCDYRIQTLPRYVIRSQRPKHWGQGRVNLDGHLTSVRDTAFSPDGYTIATGSGDQTVRVWDAKTGECRRVLETGAGVIVVQFCPDQPLLASGCEDGSTQIWDTQLWRRQFDLRGLSDRVRWIQFTAKGSQVVSGGPNAEVKTWNLSTGECLYSFGSEASPVAADIIRPCVDGSGLVLWSSGNAINKWNFESGDCEHLLDMDGDENGLTFSSDASTVALLSAGGAAVVWNASTGKRRVQLQHAEEVGDATYAAFSPDASKLIASDFRRTWVWAIATGECLLRHETQVSRANNGSFAVSPDGRVLAVVSDSHVKLWDFSTHEWRCTFRFDCWKIQFSPDSSSLAAISGQVVQVWNLAEEEDSTGGDGHSEKILDMQASRGCAIVATWSLDRSVMIWDTKTGQPRITLEEIDVDVSNNLKTSGQRKRTITAFRLSPDGGTVAYALNTSPKLIKLCGTITGDCQLTIEAAEMSVDIKMIRIAADETTLISWTDGGTIRVYSAATGECQTTLQADFRLVVDIFISPDATAVVCQSRTLALQVWDARTGEPRFCIESKDQDYASAGEIVQFLPDSSAMVACSDSEELSVYIHRLEGTNRSFWRITIEMDGSTVMCQYFDGRLKIWDVQTGRCRWSGWVEEAQDSGELSPYQAPKLEESAMIERVIQHHDWVSTSSKRLLWLPPEYRPERVHFRTPYQLQQVGNTLILGGTAGKMTFVRIPESDSNGTAA